MSKRGNDNQLTKDEYDRDQDDDSTAVMGTFKQASSDEMSRRVIKAPRARKLGGATEGGPKPFAGFSGFSAPATTTGGISFGTTPSTTTSSSSVPSAPTFSFGVPPASSAPTSQSASTFGGLSFGSTLATSSATSQAAAPTFSFGVTPKPSEPSASVASSTAPTFPFGGSGTSFGGFGKSATTATSSPFSTSFAPKEITSIKATPSSPTISFGPKETMVKSDTPSTSTFSFGTPLKDAAIKPAPMAFSFGSSSSSSTSFSSNPFAATPKETVPAKKAAKDTEEEDENNLIEELTRDLNNDLTDLNNKFSEKVLKELKKNSHVNLATLFSQYTSHRRKVKDHYLDLIQSAEADSVENDESENEAIVAAKSQPQLSGSMPKISFGIPSSNASTTKEGESKPTFSGFSFGGNSSSTSSTMTTAAAPAFGGFGKTGTTAFSFGAPVAASGVKSPSEVSIPVSSGGFVFSVPTPSKESSSSLFSTPASSSATMSTPASAPFSTPFTFNPKPFSFNPPAVTALGSPSAAVTPAPFAGFSVPASLPGTQKGALAGGDNEKVPDDTKSELVDSREGEEGEETVYEVRAKLYGFQDGEHKDLGVGQFRINENTESKKRRMIMRTSGTGMLTLNSWVIQGMGAKREKNTVTVFGIEDGKPKRFLLRVKEEQSALDIVKELEKAQQKKD
ncbi:hypothetical protein BGZ83_006552 [Gryganskiella cystojenkinii]|nr:hypothetical protein BGZ83_006552 [Gryganskiella cystojenkinii]